jgi:hypothetical protein
MSVWPIKSGPDNVGYIQILAFLSQVMKTLVIHPEDHTTEFLTTIYANLNNKTVIKGGVSKSELRELIKAHDRVLMLGHGSPYGLLSRGQFPDAGLYIVDLFMISALKEKSNCMFIWCYADQFVKRHGLSGLCTGMFISEAGEADYWGFKDIDENLIDLSNERFSWIISKYINQPIEFLYNKLLIEYGLLAKINPIAMFNLQQIHLAYSETIERPLKVVTNDI